MSDEDIRAVDDITNSDLGGLKLSVGPVLWPPKIGDHLGVNFDVGFYIGKVIKISESKPDKVKIDYMHPKKIATDEVSQPQQFWIWPSKIDQMWTDMECVLPIYPVLEVATPPSTSQCVVFELENLDIVQKLAEL